MVEAYLLVWRGVSHHSPIHYNLHAHYYFGGLHHCEGVAPVTVVHSEAQFI
jgi:hypothetical protein